MSADPVWVPLLTHYQPGGRQAIDRARTAAQVAFLRPWVRQFFLAGSTGDGWDIGDETLLDLVDTGTDASVFGEDASLLFGVLRPTTEAVVRNAVAIEDRLSRATPAAAVVGLAICPPVSVSASQDTILRHYGAVLAATSGPIAVYQFPQVTRCAMSADTVRELTANRRVVMYKDSGGMDDVAKAGAATGVMTLRGAESAYAEMLKPRGPYDGWLLSSGNALPQLLRRVADELARGEDEAASASSARLSAVMSRLLAAVDPLPFGLSYSNANRIADHLLAWGGQWRTAPPPVTAGGDRFPSELMDEIAGVLASAVDLTAAGYLAT